MPLVANRGQKKKRLKKFCLLAKTGLVNYCALNLSLIQVESQSQVSSILLSIWMNHNSTRFLKLHVFSILSLEVDFSGNSFCFCFLFFCCCCFVYHFLMTCLVSEVTQSCPTLCDHIDCSLSGSSVHGIFQAIVLEWIAISFSRGSSQPRALTWVSRIVDRHFTIWAMREVMTCYTYLLDA